MSFKHQITFSCNSCETEYLIDEDTMELPPGWFVLHVIIADIDGRAIDDESEILCHFCSHACLIEYTQSSELREQLVRAAEEIETDDEDEDEAIR